ncbi:MAG: hypothetical protein PHU23_17795, partial [Dehalococcoidales bacterium]|nr:hypothetical protein [Dehalococcoidales bacterium]
MLAAGLNGKLIQNISSTHAGGGAAETLARMMPLMEQLGLDIWWNVINGSEAFSRATGKIHNALCGRKEEITPADFEVFREITQKNMDDIDIFGNIVFIHDFQPCGLVLKKAGSGKKWIWGCQIDISQPDEEVWRFIRRYIFQYDASVFPTSAFSRELPIRQFQIPPSIDPLSDRNRVLPQETINAVLDKYEIPRDKPIIAQVSRVDYLNDPKGVIQTFELVRKSINCRLVFAGETVSDDPEFGNVLAEVRERAGKNPDIHILAVPPNSDIDINALQRAS